ncbi:MAG: type IV pilin protein, partial [Candidatus Avelusimicrobium sp.]
MKKSKKKAFTLTELLIVVIVIGVLSAAVLPKFNKVIETRKTTEAEELMASVRTEQEKRCALDKRYLTQMSEMTDIVKNNETKNFTIALAGRGIEAKSKGKYNYTLKMPSYADGRICCEETGCSKLNKEYPT